MAAPLQDSEASSVSDFIDDGDDYMPPESSDSDDDSIEVSSDTNVDSDVDSDGDDLVFGIRQQQPRNVGNWTKVCPQTTPKTKIIFFLQKKTESQMIKLTRFSDTVFICLHKTKTRWKNL